MNNLQLKLRFATVALAALTFQAAMAQSIRFLNPAGQSVSSWRDGDRITVAISGGSANAKWVTIHRQLGYANSTPIPIYNGPYSPQSGLRYSFTAYYPGYVSITAQVRTASYGSWITMNTLWKNQP